VAPAQENARLLKNVERDVVAQRQEGVEGHMDFPGVSAHHHAVAGQPADVGSVQHQPRVSAYGHVRVNTPRLH
jgi:hypothetical protein